MITLTMDLENSVWICSGQPEESTKVELGFYLDLIPGKTKFKNFDYSFAISGKNEEDIHMEIEPQEVLDERGTTDKPNTVFPWLSNIHYISNLMAGQKYTLHLFFKNMRNIVEDTYTFTMVKPSQPYPDWVWDRESCSWVPPVPMPTPVWDEESKKWIIP